MRSDGIDIAIAENQRWTKDDLKGRIEWPYDIVKDHPIPAGHPYWMKAISRNQSEVLGLQDRVTKVRILGFHPKIEALAQSYKSYDVVEPVDEEHGGANSAPSASSGGVPPPPVPYDAP